MPPFVIHSAPQIMCLAVDANEDLIKVPAPARIGSVMNAPLTDLGGKHWSEPVPPETHRLVAYIDAAFEQQILDLAQRQRIANVHHHREADYLR